MFAALVLVLVGIQSAGIAPGDAMPTSRWAQDAIARALAACAEIADDFRRAQALAEISEAQVAAGDTAGAHATLAQALASAQRIDGEPLRSWALHDVGLAEVRADDLATGESIAESIHDAELHDAVLAAVVDARRGAKDIAGALATARRMKGAAPQGRSLRSIAIVQASESDFPGALLTARSIPHAGTNALALGDIAAAMARDGSFEEARLLVARIRDSQSRAHALADVAAAQASAGDVLGAQAVAAQLEDKLERAQALARIASVRAGSAPADAQGMFERALGLVSSARASASRKCDALIEIARAQLMAGEVSRAAATLEHALTGLKRVKDASERLDLVTRIAPLQARAGEFAGAFATAMRAEDASLRPLLVRDIATSQAEKGDAVGAIALARGLDDQPAAAAALFGVMRAQWQGHDVAGFRETIRVALETVRAIGNPELRAGALGSLAAAHAEEGDLEAAEAVFAEAMRAATTTEPGSQRAAVYARIADALADRHRSLAD